MALSIKKIFSKKDNNPKNVEAEKSASNNKPNNNSDKSNKHSSPTGCCGSCS
ncbi:CCGSCS motif protein [Photobacterium sp.]|uniref:CCGSCS motif protein n=1 Tax=Photobacterium sp. TaxID=660 RepID=UPI00299ECD0F|nr:CCGSCS motif protein [Photobacterium sp.]MDX1304543.1 CCGSCS motif protein [Photobacterium sp.]